MDEALLPSVLPKDVLHAVSPGRLTLLNGQVKEATGKPISMSRPSIFCLPLRRSHWQIFADMRLGTLARPVSIILHALLSIAHAVLLCIWARGAEHSIVLTPVRAQRMPTETSLVLQAIIIPYTAFLVLLTQYMALRSLLAGKHTLTAVQDVASAWTGLGAALVNMWRQFSSPSSFLGIITVTVYLVCISTLHVTTPSLLSVQSFNLTDADTVPVTVGMPVVNTSASPDSQSLLWEQAAPFLQYGDTKIQYLSTIGLANSTIYDTIRPEGGLVEVTVNATTANVTCGCIPNATATLVSENLMMVDAVYGRYHFTAYMDPLDLNDGPETGLVYVTMLNYNLTALLNETALSVPMGRSALVFTTLDVTDDEDQAISTVKGNYNGSSSLPLQFLGCTLGWTSGLLVVDGATRQPAASLSGTNFDPDNRPSIRTTWEPDLMTDSTQVDDSDSWASMLFYSGPEVYNEGLDPLHGLIPNPTESTSYQPGSFAVPYLKEVLGLATSNGTQAVRLTAFEASLSKMTAATYWSAAHLVDASSQADTLTISSGTARGSIVMFHLNINVAQVAVGLGASTMMLIIATILALRTARSKPLVDEFGPMHIMWLVATNTTLNQRIAGVEVPSTDLLREAGMTDLGSFNQPAVRTENDMSEQWQDGDSYTLSQSQFESRGRREVWVYTALR
ncbi:uncharacterized protein B0H18DRAFT_1024514 [Fomitopsis serialis]|uniref:uncharacterized protein n=1 Tax=Fomitopsis serialis TaxID=139415 RepID=UPI00200817C8|nr:uncharacterized protein B0H18DRAFT_1024514 [Neoantrodia serialis]KAH9920270.1 hypothetical protein B0H18DRAFT_1024514 [Neoantrodia serialis]